MDILKISLHAGMMEAKRARDSRAFALAHDPLHDAKRPLPGLMSPDIAEKVMKLR
jgi:hypothetical protein